MDSSSSDTLSRPLGILHTLISSRLELLPDQVVEKPQPAACKDAEAAVQASETRVPSSSLYKPGGRYAFRLFSSQSEPRMVCIKEQALEDGGKREDIVAYPPQPLPLNRILDVEDEPKRIRKHRQQQIRSVAVDVEDIKRMATQFQSQNQCSNASYQVARNSRAIRASQSQTAANLCKGRKVKGFPSIAIIDGMENRLCKPKVRQLKDGVLHVIHTTSPVSPRKFKGNNKTQNRRRRRERKKERALSIRRACGQLSLKEVQMTQLMGPSV